MPCSKLTLYEYIGYTPWMIPLSFLEISSPLSVPVLETKVELVPTPGWCLSCCRGWGGPVCWLRSSVSGRAVMGSPTLRSKNSICFGMRSVISWLSGVPPPLFLASFSVRILDFGEFSRLVTFVIAHGSRGTCCTMNNACFPLSICRCVPPSLERLE